MQVDIEMSFTTKENIQRLIEGLLNHVWPQDMGMIPIPFPEMTYKDAMKNYGVDKPDTRFDVLVISAIFVQRTKKFLLRLISYITQSCKT